MDGQHWWWLSTLRMTVSVRVDGDGFIVEAPPIVRVFKGQHIDNLRGWLKRQGGYQEHKF